MNDERITPFDNIESAHEYVGLLAEAIDEAVCDIAEDTREAAGQGDERRLEALQLATYKLRKLRDHMTASRRLLTDLRMLRRLLLGERRASRPPARAAALPAADDEGGFGEPLKVTAWRPRRPEAS